MKHRGPSMKFIAGPLVSAAVVPVVLAMVLLIGLHQLAALTSFRPTSFHFIAALLFSVAVVSVSTLLVIRTLMRIVSGQLASAEHARREARSLFETVAAQSPMGISIADAFTRSIVYMNEEGHRICGTTAAGYPPNITSADWHIVNLDGSALLDENIPLNKALREGISTTAEFRIVRTNGSSCVVLTHASPVRDESGTVTAAVAMFLDQTRAYELRRTLLESQERYRSIFENSGTSNSIFDRSLRLIMQNSQSQRELGRTIDEALGKLPCELFGDVVGPRVEDRMRRVLESGVSETFETGFDLPGGKKWFSSRYQPMRNENGDVIAVQIISHDVTDQHRAFEHIEREHQRLEASLSGINDAVLLVDAAGRVEFVNQAAERFVDKKLVDIEGLPLDSLFDHVSSASRTLGAMVSDVLHSGKAVVFPHETVLSSIDGRNYMVAGGINPIISANGIDGAVAYMRDVSEQRHREFDLQTVQKADALAVLSGGVAHDLNNMLAGMFGHTDLAAERIASGNIVKAAESIMQVQKIFERARALTQQLLLFSRKPTGNHETVDIVKIVTTSCELSLAGTPVTVTFDIPASHPLCFCDANRIGQVFDNLVINARQAMNDNGTVHVAVTVLDQLTGAAQTRLPAGRYVRISVTDSGPGIPMDILPHIFEPFFSTKKSGNGLGLATVMSIIEEHGGWIDIDSKAGIGTTFHILLPEVASASAVVSIEPEVLKYSGRGRILVMDDEKFMQIILSEFLVSFGFEVTVVEDGDAAVAAVIRAHEAGVPFKSVILDLTIPGGRGGVAITSDIRMVDPLCRVIAMSGYAQSQIKDDPLSAGFEAFVRKPFKRSDVAAALGPLVASVNQ